MDENQQQNQIKGEKSFRDSGRKRVREIFRQRERHRQTQTTLIDIEREAQLTSDRDI